jgi:D-tyrosyl-tRNA(Tyr) deacylase
MQVLLQRVEQASVAVEGQTIGEINHGLLILLCAERGDTDALE